MPRVTIIPGDCVEIMQGMADASVDAICTDPPYGLEFMGKEWDRLGAGFPKPGIGAREIGWQSGRGWNESRCGRCGLLIGHGGSPCVCPEPVPVLDRSRWDGMQAWHARWAVEAFRVLKPGGYLVAFGGTRTYHRLACAIEDAGFEIRDCLEWVYGSGFPKSLDVGKALDKAKGNKSAALAAFIRQHREAAGLSRVAAAERVFGRRTGAFWNWEEGMPAGRHPGPDPALWPRIKEAIEAPDSEWDTLLAATERTVVGKKKAGLGSGGTYAFLDANGDAPADVDVTAPATDAAKRWDGWGTALKPAHEPIVLARKPLVGTVAENVTRYGTGALNVDGCRVATADSLNGGAYAQNPTVRDGDVWSGHRKGDENVMRRGGAGEYQQPAGRWPPNLLLTHAEGCRLVGTERVKGSRIDKPCDTPALQTEGWGSIQTGRGPRGIGDADGLETVERWECVEGCPVAALDRQSGTDRGAAAPAAGPARGKFGEHGIFGTAAGLGDERPPAFYADKGGASRFFPTFAWEPDDVDALLTEAGFPGLYCAKAARSEREEGRPAGTTGEAVWNNHPTVKPIGLMRWLVRLVTPPGGLVLDPFGGSGTTGCACALEGFDCVLIENDPHSVEIARARVAHWQKGG